jgi:hypothetical protein
VESDSELNVFEVITDFLASSPDPQAILDFRLPPELEARAMYLLARKKENQQTFEEELEMYDFLRVDDLMTMLKAKTRLKLSNNP